MPVSHTLTLNVAPEAEEMRLILSQLPVSLTDEEMDEILWAGDANGDGVFNLAELG